MAAWSLGMVASTLSFSTISAIEGRVEPVVALEMAHSVSAVRVRPGKESGCQQESAARRACIGKPGNKGRGKRRRTFSLGSMLAHLAHQFGDSGPIASTAGIVELLDVAGGLGLWSGEPGVSRGRASSDGGGWLRRRTVMIARGAGRKRLGRAIQQLTGQEEADPVRWIWR